MTVITYWWMESENCSDNGQFI